MHLRDPVAQGVEHQPAHHRVVGLERVSTASEIRIAAPAVEDVVGPVVEAAEGLGRPLLVPLGGVVEDHVEDHLDAGPVQRLHHVPEVVERAQRGARGGVGLVRGEEGDGGVAPVVDEAAGGVLRVELEDRHQLHGGDAQVAKVRDLVHDAGEGPAARRGHARALVKGEPLHVHLVDHRVRRVAAQRPVPLPVVEGEVGHHALHGLARVVAAPGSGQAVVGGGDRQGASVGIDEQLLPVEPVAVSRIERTVDAPAVELAGADARDLRVPVVVGPVGGRVEPEDLARPGVLGGVEEAQVHGGRVARPDAEVDPAVDQRGAERPAPPRGDGRAGDGHTDDSSPLRRWPGSGPAAGGLRPRPRRPGGGRNGRGCP